MLPKDEDKLKVKPDGENGGDPDSFGGVLLAIVVVVLFLSLMKGCHGCSSGYDDTWDRIEHSVKTDPYFKQW